MSRTTKAVFFDAAGTLLRPEPSVGGVYAETARRHGIAIEPEAVHAAFVAEWKHRTAPTAPPAPFDQPDAVQYEWWFDLVKTAFRNAGHREEFGADFSRFFHDLYERFAQPDVWHIFDDVEPTLRALHARGIQLAVLSNWDNRLPRLIAATPIERYFQFVLTSAEACSRKPSREIFSQGLTRLGVDAGEALHIGDSLVEDVEGARNAGLAALLLNRTASRSNEESVTTLLEVPGRLS